MTRTRLSMTAVALATVALVAAGAADLLESRATDPEMHADIPYSCISDCETNYTTQLAGCATLSRGAAAECRRLARSALLNCLFCCSASCEPEP